MGRAVEAGGEAEGRTASSSRVLVVSASMGEGHDGAARELVRRLARLGHEATMVDFLDAPPLKIGALTRVAYRFQLRRAPWSYDVTYKLWPKFPLLCRAFTVVLTVLTGRQQLRWIREFKPDVVVTTYPLASLVLGRMRLQRRVTIPAVTFVTDFAVHPLWVHPGIDLTLCVHSQAATVATERTGRHARAPGPMVAERFRNERADRQRMRTRLGLGPDDRAVLVVAGSWGVGEVGQAFDTIGTSGRYTPIAVCGRNESLQEGLAQRPHGIALGWTDDMPALMAACDVLVQNGGGLTCMEAFAVGLPVVTYLPLPGHGRDNGDEMERAGVAAYVRTAGELLPVLDQVTSLAGRRQIAAANAMFNGDAATDVAALVHQEQSVGARTAPRRPRRYRGLAAATAAVAMVWSTLTIGVGTAAAHGIGTARPERAGNQVYLGVRPGARSVADPAFAARLAGSGITAIIDGAVADDDPEGIKRLTDARIDIANGGRGDHHDRLRVGRARADVLRSCRSLQSVDNKACHTFVANRRVDGFDLASARLSHQRVLAPPTQLIPEHLPTHFEAGHIYVLDGRALDPETINRIVRTVLQTSTSDGLTVAPYAALR